MAAKERDAYLNAVMATVDLMESFVKQLTRIAFPVKSNKPRWCNCPKCGQWHYMAR